MGTDIKEQEIIEGNKLIAEFMDTKRGSRYLDMDFSVENQFEILCSEKDLQYNISWDWLMPVCIKLGMEFVNTNIVLTYNDVIDGIRSLEGNKRL